MDGDELTTEDLERRQGAELQERAHARTDAEAETHERRADKAAYLRDKREQQKRADRKAGSDRE